MILRSAALVWCGNLVLRLKEASSSDMVEARDLEEVLPTIKAQNKKDHSRQENYLRQSSIPTEYLRRYWSGIVNRKRNLITRPIECNL